MGLDQKEIEGVAVDPNEIAAVASAVRKAVSTFEYMGISVGMYVTDEECNQVAAAAVVAINNYRSAPSI